jgi:hypothetical protein
MLVLVQLSVLGVYRPPVFKPLEQIISVHPPQVIISLPVQTALWPIRAAGALSVLVGVHVSSVQAPEGLSITGSW